MRGRTTSGIYIRLPDVIIEKVAIKAKKGGKSVGVYLKEEIIRRYSVQR